LDAARAWSGVRARGRLDSSGQTVRVSLVASADVVDAEFAT
jgi:hypothetical protein